VAKSNLLAEECSSNCAKARSTCSELRNVSSKTNGGHGIADFVRERQVLTLEDAIRRMTSLPARTFSFHDRGIIRPGFVADLVLFDPDKVTDRATFADPHRYSEGFDYVLVNGIIAVGNGEFTDNRAGTFVKYGGAR
jgi:N-acyl-D-amino-acid deacylase